MHTSFKKKIKKIYLFLINLILNLIIDNFIKHKIKNKGKINICIPDVNTTGDALAYYDFINLKFKNLLIISPRAFPSDQLLPFFFKKKNYIFFENKFYNIFKSLNNYNKKNLDHLTIQILKKKLNTVSYYKEFDERKIDKYVKFKKYIRELHINDNKFHIQKIHNYLSKKKNKNYFKKLNGYSKKDETSLLKFFNLKKNKFICVHIRPYPKNEKWGYKKDYETNPRSIYNFNAYNASFQYLIKKKIKIILMGTKNENFNYSIKNKNVIKYFSSNKQNIINDLYLANNCLFFLGTQSGAGFLSQILNKYTLSTNYVNYSGIFCSKYHLFLNKNFYKNQKKISMKKYFSSKIFFYEQAKQFNKDKIVLRDNTSIQLLKSVIKIYDLSINKKKIKPNMTKFLKPYHLSAYENNLTIVD